MVLVKRLRVPKMIVFDWHGVLDKGHFMGVLSSALKKYAEVNEVGLWRAYLKAISLGPKYNRLYKMYNRAEMECEDFWSEVRIDLGDEVALIFQSLVLKIDRIDEMFHLVERCKKEGFKIGILSDCPWDKFEVIQEEEQFLRKFDVVYFSCEHRLMKNDFKFFEKFTREARVQSEEILFVDDNPKNVKKARQFGWRAFRFDKKNVGDLENLIFEG